MEQAARAAARLPSVSRHSRPIALLLAAGLALAACGDDDDDRGDLNVQTGTGTGAETATTQTATEPQGAPTETIRVRETDFELNPANPRIAGPGVVAFQVSNAGDVQHALEVHAPGGEQETSTIDPGGSATLEVSFDRPGRYEWYCPVSDHEDRGMKGVITVGSGRAGGGGTATTEDRTATTEDETETAEDESGDDGGGGNRGSGGGSGGGGSGY